MKKILLIGLIAIVMGAFLVFQYMPHGIIKNSNVKKGKAWGIDISHHQKNIDYDELIKENKPAFVLMKTTEGQTVVDCEYANRLKKFRDLGIPVGGYHFFNYNASGKAQAENYIRISDLQKGDLYPIIDVEFTNSGSKSRQWIISEIKSFCEVVKEHYGVEPIIYCEYDYYRKYLKDDFSNYKYWISDFYREPRCDYVIWQYGIFKVDGFKGSVDNDYLVEGLHTEQLTIK